MTEPQRLSEEYPPSNLPGVHAHLHQQQYHHNQQQQQQQQHLLGDPSHPTFFFQQQQQQQQHLQQQLLDNGLYNSSMADQSHNPLTNPFASVIHMRCARPYARAPLHMR